MAAKKDYTLLQKLENLQSCFNLQMKHLTPKQTKTVLDKLNNEFECNEYDHTEEIKRYYNLITYLHYSLRNVDKAKQCNDMALKMDPESIVALGNRSWMYYQEHSRSDDFKEIEQILIKVDELSTDRVKLAVAKSEMAYSYARFGMLYYTIAESIYEDVLNNVESEDKLPVFLWQYGCGLIKRRLLQKRKDAIGGDDREYMNSIRCTVSLLLKVANQDKNLRFKARAWTELGNLADFEGIIKHMEDCFTTDTGRLSADDMFLKAINILGNNIIDIPVLQEYAAHCKRLNQYHLCEKILYPTIKVKETSKASNLLAGILKIKLKNKLKGKTIPDNEESQEILKLYESAIASQNLSAMRNKGHFLMQMGKIKEAITEFEAVYRSIELMGKQQEDFDSNVKAFCQVCHAKCLSSSSDADAIARAKELLWSAIELSLDKRKKSQTATTLKYAVEAMQNLLQREITTTESMLEQIAMHDLVGNTVCADKLRKKIEKEKMITVKHPEVARRLITLRQFNEGLFHVNQMLVSKTLPEEMREFAIKAQIDGAIIALEKDDVDIAGKRALVAFEIRFPNENSSTAQERLHVFFLANECKQELTRKLQERLSNWTNLDTISCFDATPGRLKFSNLEENMHQSSVLAILCDEDDMRNDDYDSRLFQKSVEIAQAVHMTHGKEKALIVITVSDQSVIPNRLGCVPHLSLGKLFQENEKKWLHELFLRALLKAGAP